MAKLKSKIKNYKERIICAYKVLTAKKFVTVVLDEKPDEMKFKAVVWDSQNLDKFFISAVIFSAQFYITKKYVKLSKKHGDELVKNVNGLIECAKKEKLQTTN